MSQPSVGPATHRAARVATVESMSARWGLVMTGPWRFGGGFCSPPQVDQFISHGGEFGGQPTAFATLLGCCIRIPCSQRPRR